LIAAANGALETIFRDGIEYKKAGVILSDLRPASAVEFSLFDDQHKHAQDTKAMNVMDAINARMGRDTLKVGACGSNANVNASSAANKGAPAWTMKAAMRTPCYTTRWQDLLKVG
jgi:DNA polymerase V